MPVEYKILKDKRLVIVNYEGMLKLDEILAARVKCATDPDFDPDYNIIDDISGVTSSDINFDDVSRIAGNSVAHTGVKRALLAVSDFQRGMANMYQVLSESSGHKFHIFNDYDDAYRWVLDQPEKI